MVDWLVVNWSVVDGSCVVDWGRVGVGVGMGTVVCQGHRGQGRQDGDLERGFRMRTREDERKCRSCNLSFNKIQLFKVKFCDETEICRSDFVTSCNF